MTNVTNNQTALKPRWTILRTSKFLANQVGLELRVLSLYFMVRQHIVLALKSTGWIQKKSQRAVLGGWTHRFFVLTSDWKLKYYTVSLLLLPNTRNKIHRKNSQRTTKMRTTRDLLILPRLKGLFIWRENMKERDMLHVLSSKSFLIPVSFN